MDEGARRTSRGFCVGASLLLAGFVAARAQAPPAQTPPPAAAPAPMPPSPAAPAAAPAEDPTRTPAGALTLFMASRDYRTIRQLRGVMTPALTARYDRYSVPFNGKRGIRLAAFDFSDREARPASARARDAHATVKSLWEEQGEAVELRVETIRLTAGADGLWRVATLEKVSSDNLRFGDPVAGVTTLRMALRAWQRRDLGAARPLLSQVFLKRHQDAAGGEAPLRALFAGDSPAAPGTATARRAAFQIVSLDADGDTAAKGTVRLYETVPGRPSPLDGTQATVGLVKKGPRWLLDSWN